MGDRSGRFARCIFSKYAAHDRGLVLIYLAVAVFHTAVGMDHRGDIIAIAATARHLAPRYLTDRSTPHLRAEVADLQRAHRANEADMHFRHTVVGAGEQGNAGKFEAFEDMGGVAQVAGYAVERFSQNDIYVAPIGGGKHGV
nr:hypothetical protein [Sphingobium sp. JAI105]